MELWQGELPDFIEIANGPRLAAAMARIYWQIYHRQPGESEYLAGTLAGSDRFCGGRGSDRRHRGTRRYALPLSERRIDVMFFGRRTDGGPGSLLVELKRWTDVSLEDEWARNVLTGGVEYLHPSEQALDYAAYLRDVHSAYSDTDFAIQPCAFCHDMSRAAGAPLLDRRFEALVTRSPLFLRGDDAELAALLNREAGNGDGVSFMHQIRSGMFKPARRIVESLDAVLSHDEEWHLLGEQRQAFNAIWAEVQRLRSRTAAAPFSFGGGPGTGKSVIAVQLLAEALKSGLRAVHSTGGKAFTTVMRGTFTGAQPLFVWNRSLRNASPMGLDLLLVDEAHRVRETSDDRWTPKAERRRRSQIDELLDAAKVSVFFLDEHQYMCGLMRLGGRGLSSRQLKREIFHSVSTTSAHSSDAVDSGEAPNGSTICLASDGNARTDSKVATDSSWRPTPGTSRPCSTRTLQAHLGWWPASAGNGVPPIQTARSWMTLSLVTGRSRGTESATRRRPIGLRTIRTPSGRRPARASGRWGASTRLRALNSIELG